MSATSISPGPGRPCLILVEALEASVCFINNPCSDTLVGVITLNQLVKGFRQGAPSLFFQLALVVPSLF